jgi:hypothetical protein
MKSLLEREGYNKRRCVLHRITDAAKEVERGMLAANL